MLPLQQKDVILIGSRRHVTLCGDPLLRTQGEILKYS